MNLFISGISLYTLLNDIRNHSIHYSNNKWIKRKVSIYTPVYSRKHKIIDYSEKWQPCAETVHFLKTMLAIGKQVIYLDSAKLGDSDDIHFNSKAIKMSKLKFFFSIFLLHFRLFSKCKDVEIKCSSISLICGRK